MLISNSAQFMTVMNAKVTELIERVMNRIWIELGNIIEEKIYSRDYPYTDNWHGRTNEFKDSWNYDTPHYDMGMIMSTLRNDNFSFTWNSNRDEWSHGNSWNPLTVQALDEILNDRQGGENFGFPALQSHYWDEFQRYLSINFDRIVMEEGRAIGLPLTYGQISYIFK